MVRAETRERRGLPGSPGGSHSTLPAPSLRRGCLGDTERLGGLKGDAPVAKHPRALPEQGRDVASSRARTSLLLLALPSSNNLGYDLLPFVGFGEGDTSPSPVKARTGLPRLKQSAPGHGLGPAADQNQGEHPHASAHAPWGGWDPRGHSCLWGKSRACCSHCRHLPLPSPGAPRPLPAPVPAPPALDKSGELLLQKVPTPPGQAPPRPLPEGHFSLLIFN